MKKILLLTAVFLFCACLKSSAAISVDRTLQEDYVRNSGYSTQTYDIMQVSRARALGQEFYSRDELNYQKSSPSKKFWKRLYSYFDPAADDYSFLHHDVKIVPTYEDL